MSLEVDGSASSCGEHDDRDSVVSQEVPASEPSGGFVSSVGIAKETMTILESGGYAIEDHRVDIAAPQAAAQEFTTYHPAGCRVRDPRPSANVHFVAASSLGAAEARARSGWRVCVLNFASPLKPGGGFLTGASAQEEDLCRASGLYPTLLPHWEFYDRPNAGLNTDRMIYSPGVPVIRDEAWELLPEPFCVDVVTVAAANMRLVKFDDRGRVEAVMRRRMQKMLGLCQAKGVRCLVLGAWGTGVFGLEPWRVATWFKQALEGAYFEEVIFPLMDPIKHQVFEAAFNGEGPREADEVVRGDQRPSRLRGRERKVGGASQHRHRGSRHGEGLES